MTSPLIIFDTPKIVSEALLRECIVESVKNLVRVLGERVISNRIERAGRQVVVQVVSQNRMRSV
jgi:hypothetical protein